MARVPGLRKVLDWVVTIGVALLLVLVFEAEVAKPYRIPSSSMEPTLHCAKPGAWCEGRFNDRVIANRLAYRFSNPKRGQIVVFHAPSDACWDRRDLRQAADRPARRHACPSRTASSRSTASRSHEPYVDPKLRDTITNTWHVPRAATSSWATTVCTPATPGCGGRCRDRASSGRCCSRTGRRPAGSEPAFGASARLHHRVDEPVLDGLLG